MFGNLACDILFFSPWNQRIRKTADLHVKLFHLSVSSSNSLVSTTVTSHQNRSLTFLPLSSLAHLIILFPYSQKYMYIYIWLQYQYYFLPKTRQFLFSFFFPSYPPFPSYFFLHFLFPSVFLRIQAQILKISLRLCRI